MNLPILFAPFPPTARSQIANGSQIRATRADHHQVLF
jgi:hypothetical protein